MSYEIGLAECLALVRMTDSPDSCGSGLLLGNGFLLTCAHVIELGYTARVYGDGGGAPGSVVEANLELGKRVGTPVAHVTFHDGKTRIARLAAVADHLDMVLLRLDDGAPFDPCPPPIARQLVLDKSMSLSALGFSKAAGNSHRIRNASLSPANNETDRSLGTAQSFDGDTVEGMSGGPVFYRNGSHVQVIGMAVIGGGLAAYTKVVRDLDIHRFLARHGAGAAPAETTGPANGFGLPTRLISKLASGDDVLWIRQTMPTESIAKAKGRVQYLAARPLTLGDVDGMLSIVRRRALAEARARCFAEFLAEEVIPARECLAAAIELPVRIPTVGDGDLLNTARGATDAHGSAKGAARRNDLPFGIWQAPVTELGFNLLPDGAPEWLLDDDGRPNRCFRTAPDGRTRIETLFPSTSGRKRRALLRPALRFDVWNGSVS